MDFFEDVMGKENRRYIPYLITVLIYIGIANIIGLFGFKPPTKDLNVTIALAVMSMCLIEYSGIHKNGLKHWVKHFAKPGSVRRTDHGTGDCNPSIVLVHATVR